LIGSGPPLSELKKINIRGKSLIDPEVFPRIPGYGRKHHDQGTPQWAAAYVLISDLNESTGATGENLEATSRVIALHV